MWLERRVKNVRNLANEVEKLEKLFVCMVSHTRNKGVKQHCRKILAMHCMSLLLKMFHFIVKRLSFSREVCWIPVVLLCFFFSSNEPNGTRSTWAEKWGLRASSLVYLRSSSNTGLSLGCWNNQVSATSKEGKSSVISHNVIWNLPNTFFICCLWHLLKGHSKIIVLNQG